MSMTPKQRLTERFAEQNRAAAEVILAAAKPGDTGLAVEWARRVLEPAERRNEIEERQ